MTTADQTHMNITTSNMGDSDVPQTSLTSRQKNIEDVYRVLARKIDYHRALSVIYSNGNTNGDSDGSSDNNSDNNADGTVYCEKLNIIPRKCVLYTSVYLCPHRVIAGENQCTICGLAAITCEYSDAMSFEDNVMFKVLAGRRANVHKLTRFIEKNCGHYYSVTLSKTTRHHEKYDGKCNQTTYNGQCMMCGCNFTRYM